MLLEPCFIVFYVDNLELSSPFYQDLLGIEPEKASPTFHSFALSNGMRFALKAKDTVEPSVDRNNGNVELAFTLADNKKVDALCSQWQAKEINITLPPCQVPFGYTFVACDPDGNRLRVVSLEAS